jgi:gliding motility-associated-like protein
MRKLNFIILLLVFAKQGIAQDILHLCVGPNHNFIVPHNPTSLYNWQVSDPTLATIDSGNGTHHILIDLNNTGVFQLLVEEIDVNGCIGYDNILVEIHDLPNPIIFAVGSTSFCEGDSVLLQVDSVYSAFLWNNNAASIYIYADTTANYFVSVTDTNGCSNNSNSIVVNAYPSPIADFIVDGVCVNNTSKLINTSTVSTGDIVTSIWYLGNGEVINGDTVLNIYTSAGNYYTELFVASDYGCIDSIGKLYSIYNKPIASFEYNPFTVSTLQPEMNFVATTPNYTSLFWSFDDITFSTLVNLKHEFENSGIYDVWLTVTDSNECVDSVMHTIIMYYDFVLYMPNSFTPNGDGMNDTFGPKGIQMIEYKSYEFTVYNRWGEKVFVTKNISEYWGGMDAQHGVYSWSIVIVDELGAVRKKGGEVLLIK